jgi:hypothetical protein
VQKLGNQEETETRRRGDDGGMMKYIILIIAVCLVIYGILEYAPVEPLPQTGTLEGWEQNEINSFWLVFGGVSVLGAAAILLAKIGDAIPTVVPVPDYSGTMAFLLVIGIVLVIAAIAFGGGE